MPLGRFSYDPAGDGWVDPTNPGEPMSLEDVTDGRFTARGSNVYYTPNMQFVGRIAYSSGSQLVVGNDGGVYLTNNVSRSDLVQETGEARWVQGLISGEIMLPDGTPLTFDQERVTLAPEGELVYTRYDAGKGALDFARPGDARLGEGGWRPATAGELMDRGGAGFLLSNARKALLQFRESDEAAELGLSNKSLSDLALWVASHLDILASITTDLTARVGL